jgi:hypothetical protein
MVSSPGQKSFEEKESHVALSLSQALSSETIKSACPIVGVRKHPQVSRDHRLDGHNGPAGVSRMVFSILKGKIAQCDRPRQLDVIGDPTLAGREVTSFAIVAWMPQQ